MLLLKIGGRQSCIPSYWERCFCGGAPKPLYKWHPYNAPHTIRPMALQSIVELYVGRPSLIFATIL